MIKELDYYGDPLVGMFLETNDKTTLIPTKSPDELEDQITSILGTTPVRATLYNSSLLGLFSVSNTNTILVPEISYSEEIKRISDYFDNVVEVPQYTAIGNLVALNDKCAIISPVLPKELDKFLEDVGLEVFRMRIGGLDIVGSLLRLTNNGFVLSSIATNEDLERVKEATKLDGVTSTINYGNPMVSSGIVANSIGAFVGNNTTPFEMGKVDEGLFLR